MATINLTRKTVVLLVSIFMILGAALVLVSAQGSESTDGDTVRFAHFSPGLGEVDILVDGEVVVESLGFGESTSYSNVEAGSREVQVISSRQDDEILSRNIELGGQRQTLVISNRAISPEIFVMEDDFAAAAGDSEVRMAHFSPDLVEISVELEGEEERIVDNLNYRESTSYRDLEPGNYTLVIGDPDRNRDLYSQEILVEPDTTYTLFIAGGGDNERDVQVIPLQDSPAVRDGDTSGDGNDNGNGTGDGIVIEESFAVECRLVERD